MKIFVDEDIEERYAQGLYEDYLKEQINQKDKEIKRLNNIIKGKKYNKTDYEFLQLLNSNQTKKLIRYEYIINELEKLLEEEQDRLARENSNIYEDSLGKTRLVNENIYEEVQKIKDKLKELKGDSSNE